MTGFENKDKLKESVLLCNIHFERMSYAFSKVEDRFPLDEDAYKNLSSDDLSYFDQLIFRFSKLQDSMGNRLFPSLLESLGEDITGKPFIDILTKLESLHLIENHRDWLRLRETRNIVTHEYPFNAEEVVEGLNLLHSHYQLLSKIWLHLKAYAGIRFKIG